MGLKTDRQAMKHGDGLGKRQCKDRKMAGHGGVVIAMLIVLAMVKSAAAENYVINPPGSNSGGWTMLTSNLTSYDNMFKNTKLFVGDTLTFTFSGSAHDLYEVSPADVGSCDSSNPIHTYTQTVTLSLDSAGQHAFLCSVANHCSVHGMHLLVTVEASPFAPLGAPAPGISSETPPGGAQPPPGFQPGALAPAPTNAASLLLSGSSMIVGALIAACAVLAL